MRSAVSVILSGSAPEQSMSYPDYQQTPHDHQSLLVVVRHIGRQLRTKQFNKAFDRISKVQQVKILDSQGLPRNIWIRYLKNYPVENNDWGDFQTHRKALGLITIGQCNSQEELNELCRIHEQIKVTYAFTLYDSRCVLYGLNADGTLYEGQHSSDVSPCVDTPDSSFHLSREGSITFSERSGPMASTPVEPDTHHGPASMVMPRKTPSSDSLHNYLGGHEDTETYNTSEDSSSMSESVSVPVQYSSLPDETHDGLSPIPGVPPSDTDSGKSSHTSEVTRTSLVTPSNFKARTLFYPTMEMSQALETDIEEFISALFWVLESKRLDKLGLRKADRFLLLSSLCAPFEKKDFVGLDLESKNNKRRADGRLKKQLGDLCLQAGLPSEAITHYQSAAEILKSVNDWLWLAGALEGMCSASVATLYPGMRKSPSLQRNCSLQSTDSSKYKTPGALSSLSHGEAPEIPHKVAQKNILTAAEILEKYRESVTHYTKYRQAGIIETEACIKAALVLIEQRQILAAADFLQNAVFISLQLTENEKMQRFNALAELYTKLGFHRKAAFFKRVAAMRCVSPHNPQPNWGVCHSLLLQLLDGYQLSLDPNDKNKFGFYGWPRLQIQVLHELVGTAKRKGNGALATRHMTLLLHTMLPHLGREERKEFALQLELLSKENEGIPVALALENGIIVPPVHLSNIPTVKVFKLVPPTPHLKPEKLMPKKFDDSPFVYTPFVVNRDKTVKDASKADFCWIEGELCEVNVLLENPLPIELKVSSMCLITDGVNFHVNSNVISIPAESSKCPATLTGIPLAPGNLRILGYSTYTLGAKSNIKLKSIRSMTVPHIDVEIVPALPQLEVETNKPKSDLFSSFSDSIVTSASVSLLMGESQECCITLTNTGKVPIESLELSLDARLDKKVSEIFKWSEENILSQLPIAPGASASLTVYMYGIGDFIGQPDFHAAAETSSVSSLPATNTQTPDGPASLPSRLGAISDRLRAKRTESSASNRSSSAKSNSSMGSGSYSIRTPKATSSTVKTYEAVLKLRYSGGPGLKSGHYRNCGIALYVEVTPSIYITKWDTLPGDSPSQFYLVLDLWNATQQEMEVHYAKTKQILVEKAESCRIPVPVERCSSVMIEKGKEESICCQHVVSNVDLEWVLPEISGKATLQGIRLTPTMIQMVTVSPIQWDVSINGESVKTEEMRFEAGQLISVEVWLKNHMKEELEDVRLSLDCFQDYQNGRANYRLDSSLAVIGNESILIPKIGPGNAFQHSLSLIFFVSGLYKIDFRCNRREAGEQIQHRTAIADPSVFPSETVWRYNSPIDLQIC